MQVFYPARFSAYVFMDKGFTKGPGLSPKPEAAGSNPAGDVRRPGTNRKANPTHRPGERYDTNSYRKGVENVIIIGMSWLWLGAARLNGDSRPLCKIDY